MPSTSASNSEKETKPKKKSYIDTLEYAISPKKSKGNFVRHYKQFWLSLKKEYSTLSDKVIKLLFFRLLICARRPFSAISIIKIKQRNQMDINAALHLSNKTATMNN